MMMTRFCKTFMAGILAATLMTGFAAGASTISVDYSAKMVDAITTGNTAIRSGPQQACPSCDLLAAAQNEIEISRGSRRMSKQCSAIMDSQGNLGSIGQELYEIMDSDKYASYFTQDSSLGSLCPKFNSLSDSQRIMAWTWFWTALASEEATCTVKKIHPTTYIDRKGRRRILNPRPGYGLWALEKDRNIRRGRGRACDNISTTKGQALCAVDIMFKNPVISRFTGEPNKNSYWGPVRRSQSQVIPHMKRLSLCY